MGCLRTTLTITVALGLATHALAGEVTFEGVTPGTSGTRVGYDIDVWLTNPGDAVPNESFVQDGVYIEAWQAVDPTSFPITTDGDSGEFDIRAGDGGAYFTGPGDNHYGLVSNRRGYLVQLENGGAFDFFGIGAALADASSTQSGAQVCIAAGQWNSAFTAVVGPAAVPSLGDTSWLCATLPSWTSQGFSTSAEWANQFGDPAVQYILRVDDFTSSYSQLRNLSWLYITTSGIPIAIDNLDVRASAVPLPPAAWMGLGLLAGLGVMRRMPRWRPT